MGTCFLLKCVNLSFYTILVLIFKWKYFNFDNGFSTWIFFFSLYVHLCIYTSEECDLNLWKRGGNGLHYTKKRHVQTEYTPKICDRNRHTRVPLRNKKSLIRLYRTQAEEKRLMKKYAKGEAEEGEVAKRVRVEWIVNR